MPMVQEIDYGTPAAAMSLVPAATVTLTIDGRDVTVPEGTSIMRASMEAGIKVPQAVRHRHAEQLRQLPPVPGGDRGPRRHAGLLHHPGRAGHEGPHRQRQTSQAAARGDGAVHLRPSAGLPDLLRQRQLRIAGQPPARSGCATFATATRARTICRPRSTGPTPISTSIRRSASSARAASAPARKCRARSR